MREIKFRVVFAGKIINSKDYNLVCDLAENNGTTLRVEYNGYVFSGDFASDKETACLNLVGNPSEYIDVSYTGTDYITTQAIVVSCAPKPEYFS